MRSRSRGSCRSGSPGGRSPHPDRRHVDPHENQREQHRRDDHRRLAQRLQHRAARHLVGLRPETSSRDLLRLASSASSLRPVLARNTSSSDGWCNCRSATRMSAASSARTTATRSSPLSSRTAARPGGDGHDGAEPAQHLGERLAIRAIARHGLHRRPPDLRLQHVRRALGDDASRGR